MASLDSGMKPLQNAMKMAKVAIQLDGENKPKEAYYEYLRTINYISHTLLEEADPQKETEMVAVEVERMLRLAEQCLERAKSFMEKSSNPPDLPTSTSAGHLEPLQTTGHPTATTANTNVAVPAADSHTDARHIVDSTTKNGSRRVLSDGGGELSPFLPPEVFQRLQTVASQDACKKELTPLEEASRLNQKLKANYEARLARLAPGQAYQKTSLDFEMVFFTLTIHTQRENALGSPPTLLPLQHTPCANILRQGALPSSQHSYSCQGEVYLTATESYPCLCRLLHAQELCYKNKNSCCSC